MKRFDSTPFVMFVVSVVLLLTTSLPGTAATFSGKIVDNEGTPVPGIIVTVRSFKGTSIPGRQMSDPEPVFPQPQPSRTDETGAFSIANITPSSVTKLTLFPIGPEPDYDVIRVEIEGISFNVSGRMPHWERESPGPAFVIAPGADIKNVKITVRPRMRIRGQVLLADGTPLRNTHVDFRTNSRDKYGNTGRSTGTARLDAEGRFVRYLDSPGHYTVSVSHHGQVATSQEILLEDGQRLDGLVLTLKGEPNPPKRESTDNVRKPVAPPKPKPKPNPARRFDPEAQKAARQRRLAGVWIGNPQNRHVYKQISCRTREEAGQRATAENAYLVTINDKAEQDWLRAVFGKQNFWIGLTDGLKQEQQRWDNGEPLTYTNWNPSGQTDDGEDNDTGKNYTVLIGFTGKWQTVRKGGLVERMTKKAVLEKEIPIAESSKSNGDSKKR